MRRTPVFGDPKTGFVFQRVFGSEDHMTALLGFLNDLLQLDEAHRINPALPTATLTLTWTWTWTFVRSPDVFLQAVEEEEGEIQKQRVFGSAPRP